MLSDVYYYPTIDNTNVKSLEYIVTDGSSFTDIQPRDMTYTVKTLAAAGQACQVTATAKNGACKLATCYFTNSFSEAVNRSYATPSYLALAASAPFTAIDNGFAGQPSDGLTQLSDDHALTTGYADASDGDVTTTVGLPVDSGSVVMALGFGSDEQAAVTAATTTARTPSGAMLSSFTSQWQRYHATLRQPPAGYASAYWTGVNVLKASLDKTFAGAVAASLASPWGQAVPAGDTVNGLATYFGSYRETFSRDAYEAFTGFLTEGDLTDARAITLFLFDRQQLASGAFPRNSLSNGKAAPDTGGLQLDETAYPIVMDWQAGLAAVSGNTSDGYITITVPTASLGSFGSGWSVAVALFGQDGYGTDDARAFTATPEAYTFGVCATASSAPACQVSPSIEPEVMDTIAVPGVSIGTELNLLNYPGNTTTQLTTPVVLPGVTVP